MAPSLADPPLAGGSPSYTPTRCRARSRGWAGLRRAAAASRSHLCQPDQADRAASTATCHLRHRSRGSPTTTAPSWLFMTRSSVKRYWTSIGGKAAVDGGPELDGPCPRATVRSGKRQLGVLRVPHCRPDGATADEGGRRCRRSHQHRRHPRHEPGVPTELAPSAPALGSAVRSSCSSARTAGLMNCLYAPEPLPLARLVSLHASETAVG